MGDRNGPEHAFVGILSSSKKDESRLDASSA